jgi:addiction module HigA family antidote
MNNNHTNEGFTAGKLLSERYLGPSNLSIDDAAKKIGFSKKKLKAIIEGEEKITIYSARKLARAFKTTTQFWFGKNQRNDTKYLSSTQANTIALHRSIAQYNEGMLLDMEMSLVRLLLSDKKIIEFIKDIIVKEHDWIQTDRSQTPTDKMKIIICNFDSAVTNMLRYMESKYSFDDKLSTALCKRILDEYKLRTSFVNHGNCQNSY